MAQTDLDTLLIPVLERDSRYARAAYHFVCEALDHTQAAAAGQKRHVTGQELLDGIRQFALKQFGPMTCLVFEEWGIRSCSDFGEIVFNMIEEQILSKTETDRREDFQTGFDFNDAFRRPFAPEQSVGAEHRCEPLE